MELKLNYTTTVGVFFIETIYSLAMYLGYIEHNTYRTSLMGKGCMVIELFEMVSVSTALPL